ncbi:MAG: ABC transporter substrate-binding protein [Armatimonadetes bacterium]|nr:ABC transporter substrate-binding protein [Armatimonadota bacterium]
MKRWLPFFVALALTGCSQPSRQYGGELPEKVYGRIISLSPSTTELIAMLNSTHLLVGRTAGDTKPDTIKGITIVANPRPDIEKIIKLQPDLIVVEENLINPVDLAKIKEQKGFDVVTFDINSIDAWVEAVWKLGALTQQYSQASDRVDALMAVVRSAKSIPLDPKPRALVAMGGNRPWVAGVDSLQADLIRNAGGEPIGPPGDKFAQVNPEQVLEWNPDIVFASDPPAQYSGPAWKGTKAAKEGRILQVDRDLLLRAGADVQAVLSAMSREFQNMEVR